MLMSRMLVIPSELGAHAGHITSLTHSYIKAGSALPKSALTQQKSPTVAASGNEGFST